MMTDKKKIGEILVENGTISEKTLQRALERAEKQNAKIGYILEEMGVITGQELAEALALQFGYKMATNIDRHTFPADVLNVISVDIAMRYLLFPLKREKNVLSLAMADPADTRIVSNIAENNDLTVIPVIASRADIIAAINKHYLGKDTAPDRSNTVLIAEDSPLTGEELAQTLISSGFKVIVAKDGIEAFKIAISESPKVIITDKEMPGFGGYRLLESIKSLHETKNIPVILLTASSNSEEEADAFRKGFFDFITKPVKDVTLITRIKRAIQACEGMR